MNRCHYPDLSSNLHIEIKPEIELLAGVLSQTSWMKVSGPYKRGNSYFRELSSFFAPYKNHEAIKIAEELTQTGFDSDAPVNFILSLGPLPNLEPVNGYSDYLIGRGGGSEKLESFRKQMVKLAKESNFEEFYQQRCTYYGNLLNYNVRGFDGIRIITWLQNFFGAKGDEIIWYWRPACFPTGDTA